MPAISTRIATLKELIQLEERRSSVQEELDGVTQRMMSLRDVVFDEEATAPFSGSSKPVVSKRKPGRTPRGELTSTIFAELQRAGANGLRVTELAKTLGMKPANAYAWFQTASKKYPQIKKVDRGVYRLNGDIPATASSKSTPTRAATPAKIGRDGKRKTGRGALKQSIMELLSNAGAKVVSVKEISESTGAPYKNVSV